MTPVTKRLTGSKSNDLPAAETPSHVWALSRITSGTWIRKSHVRGEAMRLKGTVHASQLISFSPAAFRCPGLSFWVVSILATED